MTTHRMSASSCASTGFSNAPATRCNTRNDSNASPTPTHHGNLETTVIRSSKNRSRFAFATVASSFKEDNVGRNPSWSAATRVTTSTALTWRTTPLCDTCRRDAAAASALPLQLLLPIPMLLGVGDANPHRPCTTRSLPDRTAHRWRHRRQMAAPPEQRSATRRNRWV